MLENRMILPRADDDKEMVTLPDGFTVMSKLDQDDRESLIRDYLYELRDDNREFLQHVVDHLFKGETARRNQHKDPFACIDWQCEMRAVWLHLVDCATKAGESEYATEKYLKGQE